MTGQYPEGEVSVGLVDHIPVVWVEPAPRRPGGPLALWLHPLSRAKGDSVPFLRELAGAGFVAVGFDAWQHGERAAESGERILERVFGGFRRHMWPILGQTTLDALRVLDWAVAELGAGPEVVAGGVSMGGDVAVALAGVDERVARVAAIVSTPDWSRPGMRGLADPSCLRARRTPTPGGSTTISIRSPTSTPTRAARPSPSSAAPTTPTCRPTGRNASGQPSARRTRRRRSGSA